MKETSIKLNEKQIHYLNRLILACQELTVEKLAFGLDSISASFYTDEIEKNLEKLGEIGLPDELMPKELE
jgi:hypothetical protein